MSATAASAEPIELVVDAAESTWTTSFKQRQLGIEGFATKVLTSGAGRPSIELKRQPAGFTVPAHMHTTRQFQLLLCGSIDLAGHGRLEAPAVHYTDAWTPYGPFTVGPDMVMVIVRPTKAGHVEMADRRAEELTRDGRERVWSWDPDAPADHLGPMVNEPDVAAHRVVLVPGQNFETWCPPEGCCVAVERGALVVGERELAPGSVHFGRDRTLTSRGGPDGAVVLVVAFGRWG